MQERDIFDERQETKKMSFACPFCRERHDYDVRWMRRTKKDRLPGGADGEDRAKFEKMKSYLLRIEDDVVCKTCGRKFEIPSQQSMQYLDQFEGLPNDEELEREIAEAAGEEGPEPERKPALPARFTRKSSGWK